MPRYNNLKTGQSARDGIQNALTDGRILKAAEYLSRSVKPEENIEPDAPAVDTIEFVVYGQQRPQGSKIPQAIYRKDGTPVLAKNGRVATVVRNDNPHLESWRQQVAWAAKMAFGDEPLITGPVKLTVRFQLPRPKSHFGTGKNASVVKKNAPKYPTGKPDSTKLLRAIEDAITGIVWRDDSQIVRHEVSKDYGEGFVTFVRIEPMKVG